MKRILVLESSRMIADIVCNYIVELGDEAVWAPTVDQAAFAIKELEFDAAVLDYIIFRKKGTDLLPLPFECCLYTGLVSEALAEGHDVPVFDKSVPYCLFIWLEAISKDKNLKAQGVAA